MWLVGNPEPVASCALGLSDEPGEVYVPKGIPT